MSEICKKNNNIGLKASANKAIARFQEVGLPKFLYTTIPSGIFTYRVRTSGVFLFFATQLSFVTLIVILLTSLYTDNITELLAVTEIRVYCVFR